MRRWLFVVVAVSCGDNHPGAPAGPPLPLADGSRLHARWLTTDDGVRVTPAQQPWLDTELDTVCSSARADDGETRCVPSTSEDTFRFGLFADTECTQRAAISVTSACGADPDPGDFARSAGVDPATCKGSPRAHVTGVLGIGVALFTRSGGVCVSVPPELGSRAILLADDDVPGSSFVRFHVEEQSGSAGARLVAAVRIADDGATEPAGILDTELGVTCTPTDLGDGVPRCVPEIQPVAQFADAACTQPLVVPTATTCGDPGPAVVSFTTMAGDTAYARIGAAVSTPSTIYVASGSPNPACQPVTPPGATFLGATPLAVSDFAPLHETDLGDGRIVERTFADDAGTVVGRLQGLRDTLLDETVHPEVVDGHFVLLPTIGFDVRFSDRACTARAVTAPTRPGVVESSEDDGTTCGVQHLFAVGDPLTETQSFVIDVDGNCVPDGHFTDPAYAVGEELPLDTFVELHVESE